MRSVRLVLLITLVLSCLLIPAVAQQIRYLPDFSAGPVTGGIQFNGSILAQYGGQTVLRLAPSVNPNQLATSTYFKVAQPVTKGFFTYFTFKMHQPTMCCSPGDGFAFVIQDARASDPTQGASGTGLSAVGPAMGGLGYSGLNNSLAVEFDILGNPWDPNGNHIAIQTCGAYQFNSPVHEPGTYTIGNNNAITSCLLNQNAINDNLPSMLGPMCNGETCTDSSHYVVIEYIPPAMNQQMGSLLVYLDPPLQADSLVPVIGAPTVLNVPYNLLYSSTNQLGLVPSNLNQLYVGFTASAENGGTTTDIVNWVFTPQAPTQITLPIANGGVENDFTFGGHQLGVTYPSTFSNCQPNGPCILMTVTATPVNQQMFYMQRLQGTQFANETCIPYLQAGDNNCIDYSVTCSQNGQPVMCPQELETDDIAICSQFETQQVVSQFNTDLLEADPIGSNNWCSIWTFFNNNDDPVVGGKGTGFSDVVATLSPTGPGPACFTGGLKHMTKTLEKTTKVLEKPTSKRSAPRPDQGSGFCPGID
ncbi:MAG TPA: L-type lectin-domain containing protein [Candidatus Bathyarchaeia archaeon]|nr:L-type lectin-domain containing protein [Candidatus Bathyarchaeia archaeon]